MNKNHLRTFRIILILLVAGLFNSENLISEKKVEVKDLNHTKKGVALIKTLDFETIEIKNEKLPTGTVITKEEGENGLAYVSEKEENIEIIRSPKNKVVEIGTGEKAEYVGKMTGYGPDCVGCSGGGALACKTNHNLNRNGEYYTDNEYGNVRILAAALEKFPCGTIIKVENSGLGTFNAIVLDTGSAMRNALKRGMIHMDLAFKTEKDPAVNLATGSNIKYSVQRWGY